MRQLTIILPSIYILIFGLCLLANILVKGFIHAIALVFAGATLVLIFWVAQTIQNKEFRSGGPCGVRVPLKTKPFAYGIYLCGTCLWGALSAATSFYYLFKN